jgi:hypothetical protein
MSLETIFWISGCALEATVLCLLMYRQAWRSLPIFSVYCAWTLFNDCFNYLIVRSHPNLYLDAYLVESITDSLFQLGVLIELGWSVLRPVRSLLPRGALFFFGLLVLAIGTGIWPFTGIALANISQQGKILVHLQQNDAVLRVLAFLVLAGFSQLLSIGWRDRELQVASGLGFYSVISLAVALLQAHQTTRTQYSHLYQVVVGSYLASLLYWSVSFVQPEPERQPFTPRMQNLLLSLAREARASRRVLAPLLEAKPHPRPDL